MANLERPEGLKVFVYYNLHRHTFSIKALEGDRKGRVIAYSNFVTLTNASPKVSEAGRQRVLREGRKNVHAGIVGTLVTLGDQGRLDGQAITYNPYKYNTFVRTGDALPAPANSTYYLHHKRVTLIEENNL